MSEQAPSGLPGVGSLPLGTHACEFYSTATDLRDTLVPYFKAGLENDERCLLVAADPFGVESARQALRAAVGDFDAREKRGQIELRDAAEWYAETGSFSPEEIVGGLLRTEQDALSAGYQGLRTNGNIGWVEREQWAGFQEYESLVTRGLKGRRIVSLCSYCLGKCQAADVLEVVDNHTVTLRRDLRRRPSGRRRTGGHPAVWTALPRVASMELLPDADRIGAGRVLDALPVAIYTVDAHGYLTYFNEAAARLWGYRPEIGRQRWCGTFKLLLSDDTPVPHDQCPMAVAVLTGRPLHGVEIIGERPDGTRVPCTVYPSPLFDQHGEIAGGMNMLLDMSGRKASIGR